MTAASEIPRSAIRAALKAAGGYGHEGTLDLLARSIDMKQRCSNVPMEETLDWVYGQEHPVSVFDFSDWVEARRKAAACGKEDL